MKIKFLKRFRKDVLRLNSDQVRRLKERITLFQSQPHHPQLRNHALQGRLKGRFSINITGDIRAIYRIKKYAKQQDVVDFIRLGTHSDLY